MSSLFGYLSQLSLNSLSSRILYISLMISASVLYVYSLCSPDQFSYHLKKEDGCEDEITHIIAVLVDATIGINPVQRQYFTVERKREDIITLQIQH